MKKILWGVVGLAIIAVVAILLAGPRDTIEVTLANSPADATYLIEGEAIVASDATIRLFGEPTLGDLDGDGDLDAGVILEYQPGGTGTFYYVAAAVNTGTRYQGTNAFLLGDRIAPQTLEIRNGMLIANYADRAADEPFSIRPSFGKSLYTKLSGFQLVEVTSTVDTKE